MITSQATTSPTDAAQERSALWIFVAVVASSIPLFLWRGSNQWFFLDDWDFLATRDALSLHDLMRPHNEHWSTLPILVYRAMWRVFGLRHFVPWQLMTIALHLTLAVLMRVVMRRSGVNPWLATAAASLFVLFGAGRQTILWAFQIGFGGSLVGGYAHLLLADHDGPLDRRDALGIAFGIAGLLCSSVAVPMVMAVSFAVLLRRGWRCAAVHALVPGAAFGAWWLGFARAEYERVVPDVGAVVRFVTAGYEGTFSSLGQVDGIGLLLGVVLLVGLAVAFRLRGWQTLRRTAAAPIALAVGGLLFLMIGGVSRSGDYGPGFARASRYYHIVAAMTLPALAVAADALHRRWRFLFVPLIGLFLAGIPGNIAAIDGNGALSLGDPKLMINLPRHELARLVPRELMPDPSGAPGVTIGWLLDALDENRLPPAPAITERQRESIRLRLSLMPKEEVPGSEQCERLALPVTRRFEPGDQIRLRGKTASFTLLGKRQVVSTQVRYYPEVTPNLVVVAPLKLRISQSSARGPAEICVQKATS